MAATVAAATVLVPMENVADCAPVATATAGGTNTRRMIAR